MTLLIISAVSLVQLKEITLQNLPAVFSVTIAVIAIWAFQILNNQNHHNIQQDKLLKLAESAKDLSQQIDKISTKVNKEQTEFYQIIQAQVTGLVESLSNLENRLTQLQTNHSDSQEAISNLVQGNTDKQLEKLEAIAKVETQVTGLAESLSNLENRLTQLQANHSDSQEAISNLVQGNIDKKLNQLQVVVEKLQAFAITETENVISITSEALVTNKTATETVIPIISEALVTNETETETVIPTISEALVTNETETETVIPTTQNETQATTSTIKNSLPNVKEVKKSKRKRS